MLPVRLLLDIWPLNESAPKLVGSLVAEELLRAGFWFEPVLLEVIETTLPLELAVTGELLRGVRWPV